MATTTFRLMSIGGKVCPLGKILSQQPVGVFVGAALPGAMRIAEVDFHMGSHREGSCVWPSLGRGPKSTSAVVLLGANMPSQCGDDHRRIFAGHLYQRGSARMTFR
jgi:hypothetical protein